MIVGTTRVAGVIGDPVRHSLSPTLHNAAFAALGLDWVYVAFPVPAGEVAGALTGMRALGVAGLNVTMPHKEAAWQAVDRLDPALAAHFPEDAQCLMRAGAEALDDACFVTFVCSREPREEAFADAESAGRAYEAIQETIFASQSELSCFRFQLNDVWHDAVLGQVPPPDLGVRLDDLLSTGEPTSIPSEVLRYLKARRAQAVSSGLPWIERHRRPDAR